MRDLVGGKLPRSTMRLFWKHWYSYPVEINNFHLIIYQRPMGFFWIIRNTWFYPYSLAILNKKNFLSLTPLTKARKLFNFALNDSAEAFVLRLIK